MADTHYCSGCGERMDIAVWPTATFHEGCPNDGMWKPLDQLPEDRSAASPSRGSMKPGPSDDYLALLRGEITSEEYVKRLKATVDDRFRSRADELRDPKLMARRAGLWALLKGRTT